MSFFSHIFLGIEKSIFFIFNNYVNQKKYLLLFN